MKRLTLMAAALAACTVAMADDFGVWIDAGVKKDLTKKLSLSGEVELRTQASDLSRWSVGVGAAYKIIKPLKVDAGYTFIDSYSPSRVTSKGNTVDDYWQARHRGYASITGQWKLSILKISIRERYQHTYNSSVSVAKYDSSGNRKSNEEIASKNKDYLRSRLMVELSLQGRLQPFASYEFYHDLNNKFDLNKTRLTLGTDIKLNKRNVFNIYYRRQNYDDSSDTDLNILGIGYSLKLK